MSKYNLTKISTRRCYTPDEIVKLLGVNRKTCSRWLQEGLKPMLLDTKPLLIRGKDLESFLKSKKQQKKQPMNENEFYCTRCRKPVLAKKESIKLRETGKLIGKNNRKQYQKIGRCETCNTKLCRYK